MSSTIRRRNSGLGFVSFIVLMSACASPEPVTEPSEGERTNPVPELSPIGDGSEPLWTAVSRFFAPWIYQNWDDQQDFLSLMTFDGDWNALNNWENTYAYPKLGKVYVSIVEDQNRYFIYYGTFHPRDWCLIPHEYGCIPFVGYPSSHENDMEGAFVVVDKRFVTPAWPYGQILTVQTVFHTSAQIYNNCSLEGGYPFYVTPDPAFKPGWNHCIPFYAGMAFGYTPPEQTTPAPPKRFNMMIEREGHGVYTNDAVPSPAIYYYPTNSSAMEPPTWRGVSWASPYSLQWLNLSEHQGSSLWSRRLTTSTLPFTGGTAIGPHDVVYYQKIAGNNGNNNAANAPWGYKETSQSSVHVGDQHNHPAWTWSQLFMPYGAGAYLYEYCRSISCRMNHSYIDNLYWDDTYIGQPPPNPPPPPPTGCEPPLIYCLKDLPPGGNGLAPTAPVRAARWEFFDSMDGAQVVGAGLDDVSLVKVPDTDWGYSDRLVHALRIRGSGAITIRLPFERFSDPYDQVVVRMRTIGQAGRPVKFAWKSSTESTTPSGRDLPMPRLYQKGDWEVVRLDIRSTASWKGNRDTIATFDIVLDLGSSGQRVVEIDFVIIGT